MEPQQQVALLNESLKIVLAELDRLEPYSFVAAKVREQVKTIGELTSVTATPAKKATVEESQPRFFGHTLPPPDPNDQEIARLYQEGYSLLTTASKAGVSLGTVYAALKRQGIAVRPRGAPAGLKARRSVKNQRRVELIRELQAKGLNLAEIGLRLHLTRERVRQLCVQNGISTEKVLTDEQLNFVNIYLEGASLAYVAYRAGVGTNTVKLWLTKAGHPIRAKSRYHSPDIVEMSKKVADLYLQGIAVKQIAETMGVAKPEMIYRYLAIAGVKPQRKHQTLRRTPVLRQEFSKLPINQFDWSEDRVDTLIKLWEAGKTASQIAREMGNISRNAVLGKVHRLNLESRESPIPKVEEEQASG